MSGQFFNGIAPGGPLPPENTKLLFWDFVGQLVGTKSFNVFFVYFLFYVLFIVRCLCLCVSD